jgi:hypothetical protein
MGKSQSLEVEEIPSSRGRAAPPQYIDLDKLKNADGVVAIISQRLTNGVITFALFKEFVRDGREERTSFIAESLRPAYESMVKLVFDRIDDIRDDPKLLETLQRSAITQLDAFQQAHASRVLGLRPGVAR